MTAGAPRPAPACAAAVTGFAADGLSVPPDALVVVGGLDCVVPVEPGCAPEVALPVGGACVLPPDEDVDPWVPPGAPF